MWFARYFPGLRLRVEDVDRLTPEETGALRAAGQKLLRAESDERLVHTKAIVAAASAGRMRL